MTEPDALAELYGAPLEDFIAERKRLAGELKQGGDKEAAARVAKLPKPSPAAWALNHVAREAPDELAAWLDVAAELRDASRRSSEVGGDALRAAMSAHRSATANLRAVVRERAQPGGRALSESMLDRVAALLQVATADEGVAELLRAGCITEDATPAPAVTPPTATPVRRTAPARKATPKVDREAEARAKRVAELEARASVIRDHLARTREQLDERKAAARAAVRRLEDARRTLRRSESEVGAAEGAVSDAEDRIAAGEKELAEIREELRGA